MNFGIFTVDVTNGMLIQLHYEQGSSGRQRPGFLKPLFPSLKSSRTSQFSFMAFVVGGEASGIQSRSLRTETRKLKIQDVDVLRRPDYEVIFYFISIVKLFSQNEKFLEDDCLLRIFRISKIVQFFAIGDPKRFKGVSYLPKISSFQSHLIPKLSIGSPPV